MSSQKTICIIPARGGSKRLPGKNMRTLLKLPLIAYSINYAKQNSEIINHIVVTTDDHEIKQYALQEGIQVIDRPKHLAGDLSTTVSALKHVIENIEENYNQVVLLQPTNPLRPESLLKNAYRQFIDKDSDSLMTVSRNHHKLGKIINNQFEPFNYTLGQRSQDLEPLYFENGLIYIIKTSLIKENKIIGDKNIPLISNHPYTQVDIDTEEDFKFAEYILNQYPNE
ncbi:acylneuraminate cytidylyltransferase family protein [uncultured Algibacter sp.]|uniref:acylneuraminate cytidylyltransferase family protein n=1 Tax=uncultured Algibacter sp. TaxID=298659 RepID=UPI0030EEE9D8|tara:strand:- start:2378 stop:3055 length:678 start_codon:yes stop_codon:yes gene_type:complete